VSGLLFPPLKVTDPLAFGRVAVLMGGTSSEREVSLDSGRNVLEALRARGVDAHAVDGIPALAVALVQHQFDRVFNILHGHNGGGEDGVLQGLLEALAVPYTGSGVLGSALSMDKIRSKQVWLSLGLPTPRYVRLAKGSDVHAAALAAQYPGELLMEQMIQSGDGVGDEFTVGILGDVALPSIRIVPKGQWYDYHAKYLAEDTQYLCPGLDGAAEEEIRRIALEAFVALDCAGWGRVDVMRDRSGKLYLLEVNTAPGMTSHSLVPKAARQLGLEFEELCWRILEMSVDAMAVAGEARG